MTHQNTSNIHISGPDAELFLQGMLTCDLTKLTATPVLAAACNQKGRIVANFWIWRDGTDFYVTLPVFMSDILVTHLKKYVLRSKVTFTFPDSTQNPETKPNPASSSNSTAQPNTPSSASSTAQSDTETFKPIWILPETSEQFTPQMIGLEKHGGVNFTKGCYLGQEVIARTEHLGKLKRHLYQIKCDSNDVKVADEIKNKKGDKLGTVVAIMDSGIFAVIEDRAISDTLNVNGIILNTVSN